MRLLPGFLCGFVAFAFADLVEEKEGNPMHHLFAAHAVDGVAIISRSDEMPITLRILEGDPKQTQAADGQIWIATPKRMFQHTLAPVSSFAPKKKDPKEILGAHTEWECKHHNELTKQEHKAAAKFESVEGRVWAHWTYDISALGKRVLEERKGEGEEPKEFAKTQHLLSTVIGEHVLLLVATSMSNHDEAETKRLLMENAATLQVRDKALKDSEIKAHCLEPGKKTVSK